MKLFVIGDIHGCLSELIKLLNLVDNQMKTGDKLVFVGDYIDRGPASKQVIDYLIKHAKESPHEHIFLKGNHEDMMISGAHYWAANGGRETLSSYSIDPMFAYSNSYWSEIPADHKEFFNSLRNYYKEGRTVVVHAGLDPERFLEDQAEKFMLWDRDYYRYKGEYRGDEFVVIGHTPHDNIQSQPNQLAIDTACVFGGHLTCAVIEPKTGTWLDTIQVKSGFSY